MRLILQRTRFAALFLGALVVVMACDGFERRNQGLASGNNADFVAGNDMLKLAELQLRSAYEKFPADTRP